MIENSCGRGDGSSVDDAAAAASAQPINVEASAAASSEQIAPLLNSVNEDDSKVMLQLDGAAAAATDFEAANTCCNYFTANAIGACKASQLPCVVTSPALFQLPNVSSGPTFICSGGGGGGNEQASLSLPLMSSSTFNDSVGVGGIMRPTSLSLNNTTLSPPSAAASALAGASSASSCNCEHVVMVHVNAGEIFSVRVADQIQHITGPATVRMVSNNGPPMPMPMQAPPGHMIQQIVDEQGILTHVILSPHPGLNTATAQPGGLGIPMSARPPPAAPSAFIHHVSPTTNACTNDSTLYNPSSYTGYTQQYSTSFSFSATNATPNMMNMATPCRALDANSYQAMVAAASPHSSLRYIHPMNFGANRQDGAVLSTSLMGNGCGAVAPTNGQEKYSYGDGARQQVQQQFSAHNRDALSTTSSSQRSRRKLRMNGHHNGPRATLHVNHCPPLPPNAAVLLQPQLPLAQTTTARYLRQNSSYKQAQYLAANNALTRVEMYLNEANNNTNSGGALLNSAPTSATSSDEEFYLPHEEAQIVRFVLDSLEPPRASEVNARSALISLRHPEDNQDILCQCPLLSELDSVNFNFELHLSESGAQGRYTCVFRGEHVVILLQDLKPAQEYFICASALFGNLKGKITAPISFCTLGAAPQAPAPVELLVRTKNSISLRWLAPAEDNGAKVNAFLLEWCRQECSLNNANATRKNKEDFREAYYGPLLQCQVNDLLPSTQYCFRVSAINSYGCSAPSDALVCSTCGGFTLTPPEAPSLLAQSAHSLTCAWQDSIWPDVQFVLQMEDEATGAGFVRIFEGKELSHTIINLRRNTRYNFRLQITNEEGASPWSSVVTYPTLPDPPSAPQHLQLRGETMYAHSLRFGWQVPLDDGGSSITGYMLELDKGFGYHTVYEGTELEFVCERLSPGCVYYARVFAKTIVGKSQASEPILKVCTKAVLPTKCSSLRLEAQSLSLHSGLQTSWLPPDSDGGAPILFYELCVSFISSNDDMDKEDKAHLLEPFANIGSAGRQEIFNCKETTCHLTNLIPGSLYSLQVRAVNYIGSGPWSHPLNVAACAGLPDVPNPPSVLSRSPYSASLCWTAPKCNGAPIIEYQLECRSHTDDQFYLLYSGDALSYDVRSLLPATLYHFRVAAANMIGCSSFSSSTLFTTLPSSPGPVTNLRVADCSANSVTLIWSSPNCNGSPLTSYNFYLSDTCPVVQLSPDIVQYTVANLIPETTYKTRIQAVNMVGVGSFSALKFTTCGLPPAPPLLECLKSQASSLRLKWGDGRNPDMIHYTLEMTRHPEIENWQVVYSGTAHSHKVSRLTEVTQYFFRIRARNDAGTGPFSVEPVFWCTPRAVPATVQAPRVTEISEDGCFVEWTPLRVLPSRDTIFYMLQIVAVNGSDAVYRPVYRDTKTSCKVIGLTSSTGYQVRVCAIRHCADTSQELFGSFSQGVAFTTRGGANGAGMASRKNGFGTNLLRSHVGGRTTSFFSPTDFLLQWWRWPLSEQQLAALILTCFCLLVFLLALMIQNSLES